MITVPACAECNEGTSTLDEEFKAQLGLYLGRNNPTFWQSALKTILHPHKKKLKDKITDNLSPILSPMGNGAWGHLVKVDAKPIMTVARKAVRGLFWHKTGKYMPPDADLDVSMIRQGDQLMPEVQWMLDKFGQTFKQGSEFEARFALAEDKEYASVWLLKFYGEDCILVIVTPKEDDITDNSFKSEKTEIKTS